MCQSKIPIDVFCAKLFTISILSAIYLFGLYNASQIEWTDNIDNENFILNECRRLEFTQQFSSDITWNEQIANKDHKKFIITFVDGINTNLTYYESEIYYVIKQETFRPLTMDLIELNELDLRIKTNCTINSHNIYHLFSQEDRVGLFFNNQDQVFNYETNQFEPYENSFNILLLFILNGIVGLLIMGFLIYYGGKALYHQWKEVINEFIYTDFEDPYFQNIFRKYRYYACGPLFLIDHAVDTPINCILYLNKAFYSSVLHFFLSISITIPILLYIYFSIDFTLEFIAIMYLSFYQFSFLLYSIVYYLGYNWTQRKYFAYFYYVNFGITLLISLAYLSNCFLWFLFSIAVAPYRSLSLITLVVTVLAYINMIYSGFIKLRNKVKKKANNSNKIVKLGDIELGDIISETTSLLNKNKSKTGLSDLGISTESDDGSYSDEKGSVDENVNIESEDEIFKKDKVIDDSEIYFIENKKEVIVEIPVENNNNKNNYFEEVKVILEELNNSKIITNDNKIIDNKIKYAEMMDKIPNLTNYIKEVEKDVKLAKETKENITKKVTSEIKAIKSHFETVTELLKSVGLTMKEIFIMIIIGIFIFILLFAWLVFSWRILNINQNDVVGFVSSIIVPGITSLTGFQQYYGISNKVNKLFEG